MPTSSRGQSRKPKPTQEDAALMLQVAQLAALRGVDAAGNWIRSEEFVTDYNEFLKKHPRGSIGFGHARVIATHYETLGTLWKNKLLNEDLLFD